MDRLIIEPADVYHAQSSKYMSSHGLANFRRSPREFRDLQLGIAPQPKSDAFTFGSAVHALILEGRSAYHDQFQVGGAPVNPRTDKPYGVNTDAYRKWKETLDKPYISESDAATIEMMAMSVRNHKHAGKLFEFGVAERVCRQSMQAVPCQSRFDWLIPDRKVLVDLKSCRNIHEFESDFDAFGYDYQLAFYRMMLAQLTDASWDVAVVAVEKKHPYTCGLWWVKGERLTDAYPVIEGALDGYLNCSQSDYWPTGYEHPRMIE